MKWEEFELGKIYFTEDGCSLDIVVLLMEEQEADQYWGILDSCVGFRSIDAHDQEDVICQPLFKSNFIPEHYRPASAQEIEFHRDLKLYVQHKFLLFNPDVLSVEYGYEDGSLKFARVTFSMNEIKLSGHVDLDIFFDGMEYKIYQIDFINNYIFSMLTIPSTVGFDDNCLLDGSFENNLLLFIQKIYTLIRKYTNFNANEAKFDFVFSDAKLHELVINFRRENISFEAVLKFNVQHIDGFDYSVGGIRFFEKK